MANISTKYAADCEDGQKKAEKTAADMTADGKRTTLSLSLTVSDTVAHRERQEGAQDDGCGARYDDCRNYPRVDSGASEGGERVGGAN